MAASEGRSLSTDEAVRHRIAWWLPIVAFNLVPLFGVVALGWSLGQILTLFWFESGLVGLANLPKILSARGGGAASSSGVAGSVGRIGTAAFFALHYGLFWVVHGVFVRLIAGGGFMGVSTTPGGIDFVSHSMGFGDGWDQAWSLWLALAGLVVLRLLDLGRWFRDREFERIAPQRQAAEPYRRVVVLHLAIVVGGALVATLGRPILLLVVLVVVKIVIELGIERRSLAPSVTA
jgi:hypothetical protein